jgi:hypothetical protein
MSDNLQDYQNDILYVLVNENPEKWINFICETVIDSDLIKKGDDWYLYLNDQEDLADLFYDGRESTKDIVKSVFGEDHWEPYWDTTDDIYRDVVEELNEKNLKKLYERILKEVEGETISTDTEYLEDLDDSGSDEIVITKENFGGMFGDEQTLKYILESYASDIRQELFSLHSNCYNSAYEDEIYRSIWNELQEYVIGPGEWITKPHPYKKNTEIQYNKLPLTAFEADINDYLHNNKGYGNSGTLEYHGSFIAIMAEDRDCLSVHAPDYPDSRTVDKNINMYFKEYI